MSWAIDGFNFEVPPDESQIIALAQFHRKQLDEAIYHQEIRLGDFGVAQRKRVHDYTRTLTNVQEQAFYNIYDHELERLADDDDLHPGEAESAVSIFAVMLVLAVIAVILYLSAMRLAFI